VSRLMRELQWETLQERRRIQRLTFMYKILNGQVAVPGELIDLEVGTICTYYKPRRLTNNRSCINLENTLLNTRNPSYTGQSQSGILFLHQLVSPTQYLPSSVSSPLFRRAQPLVAVIAPPALGDYYPDPDSILLLFYSFSFLFFYSFYFMVGYFLWICGLIQIKMRWDENMPQPCSGHMLGQRYNALIAVVCLSVCLSRT